MEKNNGKEKGKSKKVKRICGIQKSTKIKSGMK